jgi:hypothetical protein
MFTKRLALIFISIAFILSGEVDAQQILVILDAARKTPIEGARIYVVETFWRNVSTYALRSDVNGRVVIPEKFKKAMLSIRAKNYQPLEVRLPLKSASPPAAQI